MKLKQMIASVLALTATAGCLAGCGGGDVVTYDETKTQLFVGVIDGGVGSQWCENAKIRFEKSQEGISYEEGKSGVEVIIDKTKSIGGNQIGTSLSTLPYEVYFTEVVYYRDLVAAGSLADISDIVTETLTAYEENKTIESKMNPDMKDYLKVNGSYYGVPYYEDTYSCYYDKDMFKKYSFYFAANTDEESYPAAYTVEDGVKYFEFTDGSMELSAGVDGVKGTMDDGLPATVEQFLALCSTMSDNGIKPLTWIPLYVNKFIRGLSASFMGSERAKMQFNFSGTNDSIVESINDDGTVNLMSPQTISSENGYLVYRDAGRYYALKLWEELVKGDYFYSATKGTYSHLQAQQDFILGSYKSVPNSVQKIGMIIEGSWWENESATFYDQMVSEGYGEEAARENRNFGVMPMPKLTDADVGERTMVADTNLSMAFISSSVSGKQLELAKKFLQFCYTDESLRAFTEEVNMPIGLNYEFSKEDKAKLSSYGRDLFDLSRTSSKIYCYSTNPIYLNNTTSFSVESGWDTLIDGTKYLSVPGFFYNSSIAANKRTAKTYFEGIIKNYSQEAWVSSYSKDF